MSLPSSHPNHVVDRLQVHMMAVIDRLDQKLAMKPTTKSPP
jgi:hypothetical protein